MSKIMLVEDDNSLLEIYEARLKAEGYDIVTARDGEEALTIALKEHPDLIIADIMMPKVSGFDMVDILRSTPETKATKIIMMTALNQAEDKARAEKLGADKYLVKSQVTLEDVARIVRDVLAEQDAAAAAAVTSATGIEPSVSQPKTKPANPDVPIKNPVINTVTTQASTLKPAMTPAPKSDAVKPPPPSTSQTTPINSKTPTTSKPFTSIPVATAPEPTKSNPITSMPKVANQQPPTTTTTPPTATTTTSIPVITDDDHSEPSDDVDKKPIVKDPFLAKNPTLSDSPDPVVPNNKADLVSDSAKPTEVDNSIAQKAVESLALSQKTSSSQSDDQESSADDNTTAKYLKTDKNDNSKSMTHDKVIEPTPNQEDNDSPILTNLSDISDTEVAAVPPPPVNTVITPDPEKGSTNSSQN